MDPLAEGRWRQAFPWLTETGRSRELLRLLRTSENAYRSSATQLRANGQFEQARKADRRAEWARFQLDDPLAVGQLYAVTRNLRQASALAPLPAMALDGALALLGAERGNVQLLDPATGSLTIAAQCGFRAEFLEYFAVVNDARSACGRAARGGIPVLITDVTTDPAFAPHREAAAAAGFRAVQSTPLIDATGTLLGVLSTHYREPHQMQDADRLMRGVFGAEPAEIRAIDARIERLPGLDDLELVRRLMASDAA